jgi:predicted RNA binding protein YcfA (HicA-like mRNA interferase family)
MGQREKLIAKMQKSPRSIRFGEVDALLRHEGFVLFNQRGSHCTDHHSDGRVITVVKPHGGRKTCSPSNVRKVLEAIAP